MNWRTVLYLFIVSFIFWNRSVAASESESSQLDETCASYTLSVVKPLLDHFEETKMKTEKNDEEMKSKNYRISELTNEVFQLRAQVASYSYKDKKIELCEDQGRRCAQQIESLKQELQHATKSTEKQPATGNVLRNPSYPQIGQEISKESEYAEEEWLA